MKLVCERAALLAEEFAITEQDARGVESESPVGLVGRADAGRLRVVLLSPSEVDEATNVRVDYTPPGS